MSADLVADEEISQSVTSRETQPTTTGTSQNDVVRGNEIEEEDGEEEDEEEEKLKYAKLTANVSSVYRNGDSTSAFLVGGDKMVIGTHNGNIHVLSLPDLVSIRTYHAHQATVTSVSISPVPPPPTAITSEDEGANQGLVSLLIPSVPLPLRRTTAATNAKDTSPRTNRTQQQTRSQTTVPNTPNNQIYVATSSLDGHVCVSSLVDPNDVLLRNFARPVQAVALSPDYKNDRTYLSGGLAGSLIMTVGGKAGVSSDANTNSAAAAASGWLGSLGLSTSYGKDTVLHAGEGSISVIKWSLSGKWVVWVNEEGIKIMRSHLRLGSEQSEDAWRRIAHAARPKKKNWQDMAGVWKARAEWVDEEKLEHDYNDHTQPENSTPLNGVEQSNRSHVRKKAKRPEKLVVGWGDTAWVLDVREGGTVVNGRHAGEKQVGTADILYKLQFHDCIVSGVALYTPTVLAVLAYRTRDDDDKPIKTPDQDKDGPRRGRAHRKTGLRPQLRLVHVKDGEEVELDELPMSRFETLSGQDYHLGSMYMPPPLPAKAVKEQKGALELMWEVSGGGYAQRMFTSGASVLSGNAARDDQSSVASPSSVQGIAPSPVMRRSVDAHPYASSPGLKLFIQSPYDCALAVKREAGDHLTWLLEHEQYEDAWTLLEKNPEIIEHDTALQDRSQMASRSTSPSRRTQGAAGSLTEFFADETSSDPSEEQYSLSTRTEMQRIGHLWIEQLVSDQHWVAAGQVAAKVLGRSDGWERWIRRFADADKLDDIASHIPESPTKPPMSRGVYELVLGHYLQSDVHQMKQFLDKWDTSVYDVEYIISVIEGKLGDEDSDRRTASKFSSSHDQQVLLDSLAKLYIADERPNDALRCYIRAQNADAAMALIRDEQLLEAISDDIVGLLMLKTTTEMLRNGSVDELNEANREVLQILAEEAQHRNIPTDAVVQQMQQQGSSFRPLLFLYLRTLWQPAKKGNSRSAVLDSSMATRHALVEDHADLAVSLFAEYDRDLLMEFLRTSSVYEYDKAAAVCEERQLIPELVYILGKMGQTKKALFLIIDKLGDVSQAISFAKENRDLWNDLLDYSMDKPQFIRGLLEEVGTSINPIDLVRRIPEGLEIEGLRDAIQKIIRDHEIQQSISEGVAEVIRGEVTASMAALRAGQNKAVKFEVLIRSPDDINLAVQDPSTQAEDIVIPPTNWTEKKSVKPGHCTGCESPFSEHEDETLIGFACGHVYHLSCLLRANPEANEEEIEKLEDQLRRRKNDSFTRSVGAKVAHAHLIQNFIKEGCRHCVVDTI